MDGTMKSFVIDGSERSVQDIVSKLKFISKIREGQKLDVQSLTLCEDGMGTALYRTLVARGESRENALEFVRGVIGEAFELATKYLHKPEKFFKDIGQMIIIALHESKAGLAHLAKTYEHDHMFISKLETLTKTLETKTLDLQRQLDVPARSVAHIPGPPSARSVSLEPGDSLSKGKEKMVTRSMRKY